MNKLIRDKLVDVIESERTYIVTNKETQFDYLEKKLVEELNELTDSNYKDKEEFADVLEVLQSIASFNGVDWDVVLQRKKEKREMRGGFEKFIILKGD